MSLDEEVQHFCWKGAGSSHLKERDLGSCLQNTKLSSIRRVAWGMLARHGTAAPTDKNCPFSGIERTADLHEKGQNFVCRSAVSIKL